ncbi:MAG: queuosine salvage family protein [Myxococcota bacterium]|nr:queuosine salvage family protein [Myxococcota bacterium]
MICLEDIRAASARVAERARFVRIEREPLERLALELADEAKEPAKLDPAHHHLGGEAETLAYVVTLDAINFGSGWFPLLRKRPGCSGYFTVATALRERFASEGAFSANELRSLDATAVAELLGQDVEQPEVGELMEHFARALRDLGEFLRTRHEGSFEVLVARAEASAEHLVRELAVMQCYRDVSTYDGFEVPFYKRAQLTAADLAIAFEGKGPGRFDDLARLTIFADNLVPHVLRCEGVLVYCRDLAEQIDGEQPIGAGSPQEIEIRAVALHAVERMVESLSERAGTGVTAQRLDHLLWNRGQAPAIKARPRHRARSVFY